MVKIYDHEAKSEAPLLGLLEGCVEVEESLSIVFHSS